MQRWELSARLRALRHEAGLTIEQVAEALLCSPAKVSRMETGLRAVQQRDVRDLADLYGLSEVEREELADLARGAKEKAWYESYELLPLIADFYGVESSARAIRSIETDVVPGIFQIPAYTRALLSVLQGLPERMQLDLDEQVEIRKRRQEMLYSTKVELQVILTEEAMGHCAGSAVIMAAQMENLIDVVDSGLAEIRILRTEDAVAAASAGPFQILSPWSPTLGDWLFREQALELTSSADAVRRYAKFFGGLKEISLSPPESRASLARMRDAWIARAT